MSRKKIVTTAYYVYTADSELTKEEQTLLAAAKKSLEDAYAVYSNFLVGAAVLLKNGKIIIGNNQENASYSLSICAERVALFAAASQYPDVPVEAIAVCAKSPKQVLSIPISPCGACRQVICETESRFKNDIKVILQGEEGDIHVFHTGRDLLPFSFDAEYL